MYSELRKTKWAVAAAILVAVIFFTAEVPAVEIKNDIVVDTVWTTDMSPYIIMNSISIAQNVTLTIKEGVIIKFGRDSASEDSTTGYTIRVQGTLRAEGRSQNPILFTTSDKDYYWGHIEFAEKSAPWDAADASGCMLMNCIIEYGGNSPEDIYGKASVRSISASPLIRNTIVRYGKADGIMVYAGVQTIIKNRIHSTKRGIAVIASEGGVIENNYLIDNEQGIYLESGGATLQVRNNTVKSTSSEIYGGCLGIKLTHHDNFLSYLWQQVAGTEVELSEPTDVKPTFIAPDVSTDESMVFQLTITNSDGLQAIDTTTVSIELEASAPCADAGPPQTVSDGAQVVLDGSDSFDTDDVIIDYSWQQTSGDEVVLSNASSAHCTFTAPTRVGPYGEDYIFQLTVTDTAGLHAKDTVIIHVTEKEKANGAPRADAGKEQTITEGSTVILSGSGSTDPENALISWLWTRIQGPYLIIHNATSAKADFIAPEVDASGKSFIFRLTVVDDAGQESSDITLVNIIDADSTSANLPPVAHAGFDQELFEDAFATVSLTGSATDPDGALDAASYEWEQISGIPVTLTGIGADQSFEMPDVTENEELVFRLTVTDEHGLRSTDRVRVTVKWVNEAPFADAGKDQTVTEGQRVVLDGEGSLDSDDNLASYLWEQINGREVSLSSSSVVKPVFTAPHVAADTQLIFQLTVEDTKGYTSHDSVIVTVRTENSSPIADAGKDQVVTKGDIVTLNGAASYDPDNSHGGIVSYMWEETKGATVTLYNATTARPYFVAPHIYRSLTFTLTVKDKEGLESSDSVIVNIVDARKDTQVPVADAGEDQTIVEGSSITLDGSHSFDPVLITDIQVSNNYFINEDEEGSGNAIAIAADSSAHGSLSIRSNNLENVHGKFLIYFYNWSYEGTDLLDITDNWWGTASFDEVNLLIYDYEDDEHVPSIGEFIPQARKIEEAGSLLSYPPMAEGGEDQTVFPDETVTLSADPTYDPKGIMSYSWAQNDGQTVTLYGANTPAATFIAPSPENEYDETTLAFIHTVTDPNGFYDTDEVIIHVQFAEEDAETRNSHGCFIFSVTLKGRQIGKTLP